jgi:hypothetical protein
VHPNFSDFLVLVTAQPDVSEGELQLHAFLRQHRFKLANDIRIVVTDLKRENPPFDVRARA